MANRTASGFSEQAGLWMTACMLSLFVLCTLAGNALVCAAVLRFPHLRSKVAYVFVASLAVSDLLVASLVMPWKAAAEVAGFWPFGSFCNVWVAFDIMCSTASILNLCIISVDRYWAIAWPFSYERSVTRRAALLAIGLAWTLSVLISFVPVQLSWHKALKTGAAETDLECDASLNRTYAIASSLVSFYIPVAVMIITYTRIFFIAQRQIRRVALQECAVKVSNHTPEDSLKRSLRKETKVLKTLTVIVGVFVCCWLPFFVLNCIVPFCELSRLPSSTHQLPCVSQTTFEVFVWFGWANSTLNPVVYAFNADFRRAFSSLLGCGRLCSRNTVRTVDFSNELASFQPNTANPKDPRTFNYPCLLPHAIREPHDAEDGFDTISQSQAGVPCITKCGVLNGMSIPSLGNSETEVSLDKIVPFTGHAETGVFLEQVSYTKGLSSGIYEIL